MTQYRPSSSYFCALLLLSLAGCKDEIVDPPPSDYPPSVVHFTESPSSFLQGGTATFAFKMTDDRSLDSVVLAFGDGSSRKWATRAEAISDTLTHVFEASGPKTSTLTGYDTKGQKTTAQVSFTVGPNQAPTIKTDTLRGEEGSYSSIAWRSLASDPENDTLTVRVTGTSTGVDAQILGDSLRYGLSNPDASGVGSFTVEVSDKRSTVSATIPLRFQALDRIAYGPDGRKYRVHDILEGSYISTVNPTLVMQGPFAGFVKIDGVVSTIGSDGTGSFTTKFKHKAHAIEWFFHSLSKTTDSSFVARDTIVAGSNSALDLGGHTNAGTGPTPSDGSLSLGLLKAYYLDMNPNLDSPMFFPGGVVCGVNLKQKGSQYTIYLSARDTTDVWGSGPVLGYTPEMMDTIASRLTERLFVYIPPQNRPKIVKGLTTDALPFTTHQQYGYTIPKDGYGIGFRQDSQAGLIYNANPSPADGETKYCVVTLSYKPLGGPYPGGFKPSATLQEWMTWLVAPGGGTNIPELSWKSPMKEGDGSGVLGGMDQKQVAMFELYSTGTVIGKFLILP